MFRVLVEENSHYMDGSERYEHGTFASEAEALASAKRIVDEFLHREYHPGMTAKQLYEKYTSFGEDPFITSDDGRRLDFSAWEYAKQRCAELCTRSGG
jgi:hypothetical protein